jgi:hypothetical protein
MPANENTPKNNQFNSDYALFARSRVAVGFPTSCTVYQCLRRGQRPALSRPIRSRPVAGHFGRYPGLTQFRCNEPRNVGRKWSGSTASHLGAYFRVDRPITPGVVPDGGQSGLCARRQRSERVPRKRRAAYCFRHGDLRERGRFLAQSWSYRSQYLQPHVLPSWPSMR